MWELVYWVITIGGFALSLFTAKGRDAWGWFFNNIVGGALKQATPLVQELAPLLNQIASSLIGAVKTNGGPLIATLGTEFQDVAATLLEAQRGALAAAGVSTPENALDNAAAAFKVAFGAGLTSAGVSALFESAFPEKLNVLNGVAPMIAKMAGFDEVAQEVLKPLYKNAFGASLDYYYRSLFKPEFPSEKDAVEWHSRRLDIGWKLEDVFAVSGLKPQFEQAYIEGAYRPISVRALASAFVDVPVPVAQLRDTMQFTGNRDVDINLMIQAIQLNSVKSMRSGYLSAVMTAAERGTLTAQEVTDAVTNSATITDAGQLAQLTIAVRKLEQLAEIYRKSITEGYTTGQITDAEYLPQLEAIGIAAADAEAHYAVDSIKVRGKQLTAAARAAARAASVLQRAQIAAALAEFRTSA